MIIVNKFNINYIEWQTKNIIDKKPWEEEILATINHIPIAITIYSRHLAINNNKATRKILITKNIPRKPTHSLRI